MSTLSKAPMKYYFVHPQTRASNIMGYEDEPREVAETNLSKTNPESKLSMPVSTAIETSNEGIRQGCPSANQSTSLEIFLDRNIRIYNNW